MEERLRPLPVLFILISLSLQALAVVLSKMAALHMPRPTLIAFASSPWYLGGLACVVLQAVFWQLVLREVRLSVAYLFTSLNYFFVLAASRFFFHEQVTLTNLTGTAVIVAGIFLVVSEEQS